MTKAEIEENKRIGAVAAGRLEFHASSANDHLIRTSNWLTASLLAVNGGGAIAIFNAADHIGFRGLAAGFFITGMVFSLLSAVAIQSIIAKQQGPLEEWLGYWRGVEFDGTRDLKLEELVAAPLVVWEKRSWIAPALGWVAGLLFIAGTIAAGSTYVPPSPPAANASR